MKKLGKKLSYFTKVFLVLGLIFSNLSSLSMVFAYEATDDFTVTVTDGDIKINYLEELDDTDVINIEISENYTYLDGNSEVQTTISDTANGLELTSDGVEITSTMLTNVLFDGLYEASVTLFNETDNVELGTVLYSENITYDSGLEISLYDSENNQITATDAGVYSISMGTDVTIKSKILSGELIPTDVYSNDEGEYVALELIELEFVQPLNLDDALFGEYNIPVEVKLMNSNDEEVIFTDSIKVMYESYALNTDVLNMGVASLDEYKDSYGFYGEDKNGILYVLADTENAHSVIDLYNIASLAVEGSEEISFKISNGDYDDIVLAYEEASYLEAGLTLDSFLEGILIDDETVLSFSSRDLTITYKCVLAGDTNDDNLLSQEDLDELINQIVGVSEADVENNDVVLDDELNAFDAMYLHQVLQNGTWSLELTQLEATLDARLDVMSEEIVSGDEFTVNYVVTVDEFAVNGLSGIVKYDDTMLELVNVESEMLIGNSNQGKFLYLNDESLTGTEVEEEGQITISPEEYVVLTVTFKALMAGTSTVEITEPEYFDQDTYLIVENTEITAEVVVNESSDNDLETITVNGESIVIEEDVLDYEITVSDETTTAVVEALTKNVAATISSIVSPDELAYGENTITIVVTAENGDEKIYTITVIREEAVEEETATNINYQNTDNEEKEDDSQVIETPTVSEDDEIEKVEEEEEESKLSRIIIIILILLVIAGLIYLIFKDDNEDEEETKKANKEINKLKKEDIGNNSNSKKNEKPKNKKKGR